MKKLFLKAVLGIIAVATVIAAYIYFNNKREKRLTEEEMSRLELQKDSTVGIIPPLPTSDNQFNEFTINTERDTTIVYKTGTMIMIPKNAFVDEHGDSVKGSVDIVYREFHSIGEIILSGITMRYDSAGVEQHFRSAGMFEMNGSQNNKDISIRKESPVQVSMVSTNKDDDEFNQYKLNKASNTWEYIKKDVTLKMDIADSVKKEKDLKKKISMVKPAALHTFSINAKEFPHLAAYQDMIFKVSDKTKNYRGSGQCWLNATIEKTKVKGEYRIVFKAFKDSVEIFATDFSNSKELEQRTAKYEKMNKTLAAKLGKQLNTELTAYKSKMEIYLAAMWQFSQYEYEINKDSLEKEARESRQKYERDWKKSPGYTGSLLFSNFYVNGFGVYNCDRPEMMPKGRNIYALYANETGSSVSVSNVYLIESGAKMSFNLPNPKTISCDPNKNYALIVITADNGLARINEQEFKMESTDQRTFKLNIKKAEVFTAKDIDDFLRNK